MLIDGNITRRSKYTSDAKAGGGGIQNDTKIKEGASVHDVSPLNVHNGDMNSHMSADNGTDEQVRPDNRSQAGNKREQNMTLKEERLSCMKKTMTSTFAYRTTQSA